MIPRLMAGTDGSNGQLYIYDIRTSSGRVHEKSLSTYLALMLDHLVKDANVTGL